MNISSRLRNVDGACQATLSTKGVEHSIDLVTKEDGRGSRANGGELFCLAIASCYCNDIYREAAGWHMEVASVEVEVNAEFGKIGEPAISIQYSTRVEAYAPEEKILNLIKYTDSVAEVHNTIRQGMPLILVDSRVISKKRA
jgi:uncharacterized OsmC-like protein